jgi:GNAT superfamily N-acetyltransferase
MWKHMVSEVAHMQNPPPDPELFYLNLLISMKGNGIVLIAEDDDGKPIGFITGFVVSGENSTIPVGICDNSYVVPEHRGGRVYFKMINEGAAICKKNGAKVLRFQFRYDLKAEKTWARLGYRPTHVVYEKEA